MENEKIVKPILPAPGEEEIWVTCEEYPCYEVSSFGNVRAVGSETNMRPKITNSGSYPQIHLRRGIDNPNGVYPKVHRLIAAAFIPNDDETKTLIDHTDRNRSNNYYKNLRWVDYVENRANSGEYAVPRIYKKKTPLVLLNWETREFIREFSCPNEAGKELGVSVESIVDNAHGNRECLKHIGKFMTKTEYDEIIKSKEVN